MRRVAQVRGALVGGARGLGVAVPSLSNVLTTRRSEHKGRGWGRGQQHEDKSSQVGTYPQCHGRNVPRWFHATGSVLT